MGDAAGELQGMAEGTLDGYERDADDRLRDLSLEDAEGVAGANDPHEPHEPYEAHEPHDVHRGPESQRRAESPTRQQSLRMKVLHCLIEGDELSTLTMSKKLGLHQSSISHVIKDMVSERLIFKTSRGYRLTNMGRVYIRYIDNFEEMLYSLNRHRDFIIDHDIGGIPANHLAMLGLVLRGRDSMPANKMKPYHKNEFLYDRIKSSRKICAVLSTVIPEQITAAIKAANDGAMIRAILSGEVLNSLKKDFLGLFDEAIRCRTVEIYVNDDARLSLAITDRNLFLGLHRLDGSYDSDNLIICDDEDSMIWGRAVFHHLLKGARRQNAFMR